MKSLSKRRAQQSFESGLSLTPEQILDGIADPELRVLAQQAFQDFSKNMFEAVRAHLKKPGLKPVWYFGMMLEGDCISSSFHIEGENRTFIDISERKNESIILDVTSGEKIQNDPFFIDIRTRPGHHRTLRNTNGRKVYGTGLYKKGSTKQEFELALAKSLKIYCENDMRTYARINLKLLNEFHSGLLSVLQRGNLEVWNSLTVALLEPTNP